MMYVRDLIADPQDPDRVTAAIGYHWSPRFGVYVSDDAGLNWRRTLEAWYSGDDDTRYDGSVIVRDPSNAQRLWTVALADGLFRSDDNGETWVSLSEPSLQPTDLLVDASNPERLWVAAAALDKPTEDEERSNRDDGSLVLEGGLWRTEDGGQTWRVLVEDRDVRRIVQDPVYSNLLYGIFDDHSSVEISQDRGETWSEFGVGLAIGSPSGWGPHPHRYFELQVDRERVYAVSSRGDLYRLDRRWNRWARIGPKSVSDPENWWGATAENPTYGTTDWVNTMAAVARVSFSPHDPSVMWMTDWFSAYQSTDGGQTWVNRSEGIEVTYIDDLEQDPENPNIVHMGMADNGYFRSTDGGTNFRGYSNSTAVTNNLKSISVPAGNPDRVYAVGPNPPGGGWYAGQVFISDDRGQTWRASQMQGLPEMGEAAFRAHTIVALDHEPDTVFLTVTQAIGPGKGGLYVSRDAGEHWEPFIEGLPEGVEFYRHESWRGGKEIAVSANGDMLTQSIENNLLYRRAEEDAKWQEAESPASASINDIQADPHQPGRFYAAAVDEGLFRSDDGGRTWTYLPTPPEAPGVYHLIVDRVVPGRIALGTHHGVILSRDAGQTWVVLDQRLPGRVDWNKGAFAGDRLVVGSGGTGAYWIDLRELR